MNSLLCPVHANFENCLEWRLATLKVAIACAVLRNKPPGQSTREFLNYLKDFHQNKEERWKGEYQRLKQEVLQLRQELSLLRNQQSTCDTQPMLESESQTSDYFSQELDILSTPPNSQSIETLPGLPLACLTSSSRTEGNASDHSEFLRAFFYLEHRLRADRQSINGVHNNEISENDVVSRSVFTVLRHVKQGMDLNEPAFKTCRDSLHVCLQFLEHQSTWTQAIRDELAEISCHWLNYLQDNGHMMTKVFSLLIILAESQSMAIALADFLANRMMESQKVLSTWKWDGQNLLPQNILCQFCSTSFYLLLLEKTIPRLTPNVKSRLISTLSQVEPGVHTHFPLFSFSILRIVNLLSCSP